MSLYCFKTDNSPAVIEWVKATKQRGKDGNLIRNPFKWRIATRKKQDSLYCVVEAKPVYFNFSWFGWITGLIVLLFLGVNWILWPCLFVGCLGIFWTAEPLFFMTKKALKKQGYDGPVKRLKFSEIIGEVIL